MKDGPEKQADLCQFKAGLVYRCVLGQLELQRKPASKPKTKQKKSKRKEGRKEAGAGRGIRVPKQGLLRV